MSHSNGGAPSESVDKLLFWGCFMALIATAFGFIVRALIIGDLAADFNLSETEKGQILGVGLWPFALSIVLFSLVIDKIGYGKAMVFAFVCHAASAILTISAKNYEMLYWGNFIAALGNGTVEAVINPVVATMFRREKTKWLNILHAGWPGGLVIGGLIVLLLLPEASWQLKVGLVLIPTVLYGVMLFGRHFPVHERVSAGVTYRDMLAEVGAIGAFIIVALMTYELGNVFGLNNMVKWPIIIVATVAFGVYTRSLGRPLFIFLMIIMIPLATTELGTDSWISDLMTPAMTEMGLAAGWVLVYTSFVMMVLRFCAGSIVHRISPLGLLAVSAAIAVVGLLFLSVATGVMILAAATLYAFGKTFFWPTMLGVVAEQFPKGGALTLNTIAGVGMLSVGIIGSQFLGFFQDQSVQERLTALDAANNTALHDTYMVPKSGLFGAYESLDLEKVATADEDVKAQIGEVTAEAKKGTLATVAIFPAFMLICYLALIVYFRSKGGYKVVHIDGPDEAV